jgi:7,8-dihydropterin-6-yl-methyl-4-(beta-D-ribofuranosyl)aminobenzene 5'-phosphate synthase
MLTPQDSIIGQDKPDSNDNIVLTVLYNNKSMDNSVIADHGFSCLVEIGDRALLSDTGRNADKFMTNVSNLEVDHSKISWIFISHIHGDHMGGLFDILDKCNKPQLYLPFSYPRHRGEPLGDQADRDFDSLLERLKPLVSGIIQKKESVKVGESFFSTGIIDNVSYEQSLIIQTSKGLIIVTGCAHPGIIKIVKRAKGLMEQEVYLVMGGFHLMRSEESRVRSIAQELRKLTKYIGPCHCTGEQAQGIFKDMFKEDYLDIQAGSRLSFGDDMKHTP